MDLKLNNLVELTLSGQNLFSEDIFILSMFIKDGYGSNVRKINFSQNNIGSKYLEESKMIEMKMQNQDMIKELNFEELFYDSLGLEHFSHALSQRPQLEHLDISDNNIGSVNFQLLMKVFEVNTDINLINIADCKIDG
jgi:Ran GTPase-activating protein (RanGAP) involved in mRNA processing and transport